MKTILILVFLLALAGPALAVDGVLEINQTCAVQTGCFPGDTAGFPVTITQTASYRLTGNLDVGAFPGTHAITVGAPHVTLDLGGFEVAGASTCTGSGPTLSCTGGGGHGIELSNGSGAVVRNGTVRNMGGNGVGGLPNFVRIQGITAIHNGNDGISGQQDSLVLDCHSRENGEDGFDFDRGTVIKNSSAVGNGNDGFEGDGPGVVVTNSTSTGNGASGFNLQPESKFRSNISRSNTLEDSCGGGICSERRRFYLTTATHNGANALGACAAGFHMASLWEVHDVSGLAYDYALGLTGFDQGDGPSQNGGWIRTGVSTTGPDPFDAGEVHCNLWSSTGGSGTWAGLTQGCTWDSTLPQCLPNIAPWRAKSESCSTPSRVWCVEDE